MKNREKRRNKKKDAPKAETKKSLRNKKGKTKKPKITRQEREEYIAKAAYYRAEIRGFRGDSTDDWLAAEADIDATYRVKG